MMTTIDWKPCLIPFLSWMSLIGLHSENLKGFGFNVNLVFRSLYVSYVVVIESWSIFFCFLNVEKLVAENFTTDKNSSVALKWNFLIEQLNLFIFFVLGSFLSMILNGPKQWASLLKSLQNFQSISKPSALLLPAPENRIRNVSIGVVIYLIISVMILFSVLVLEKILKNL